MTHLRRAKRKSVQTTHVTVGEGMGYQMPPDISCVKIYFQQKDEPETEGTLFYQHYQNSGWKTATGKPLRNWKVLATDWIYEKQQAKALRQRIWVNRSIMI